METKNREKILLISIAALIGLWLLDVVLIAPIYASWQDRQAAIKKLQDQIADGKVMLRNASTIMAKWDYERTNALPNNQTLSEGILYKAFDSWARSSRVTLVGQRPQVKDSDDPAYSNMEWRADATGDIGQITSFLYAVENSPVGLKIDSIEESAKDDTGRQLALGLTVSGLVLNPSTNSNNGTP